VNPDATNFLERHGMSPKRFSDQRGKSLIFLSTSVSFNKGHSLHFCFFSGTTEAIVIVINNNSSLLKKWSWFLSVFKLGGGAGNPNPLPWDSRHFPILGDRHLHFQREI
jgi:hypothetical protein